MKTRTANTRKEIKKIADDFSEISSAFAESLKAALSKTKVARMGLMKELTNLLDSLAPEESGLILTALTFELRKRRFLLGNPNDDVTVRPTAFEVGDGKTAYGVKLEKGNVSIQAGAIVEFSDNKPKVEGGGIGIEIRC